MDCETRYIVEVADKDMANSWEYGPFEDYEDAIREAEEHWCKMTRSEQKRRLVRVFVRKYTMDLVEFVTRDKQTGNVIDWFEYYGDAKRAIEEYEEEDKCNDEYEYGYYEIALNV